MFNNWFRAFLSTWHKHIGQSGAERRLVDIVEEEAAAGEVLAQALIEIALLFALLAHLLVGIALDQLLEVVG